MLVKCAACGERNEVPSCPSCGTDLLVDAVGVAAAIEQLVSSSERDQTLAGRDQTASDRDQTWADRDQAASESDQRSSDDDQTASDDDRIAETAGAGPEAREAAHDRSTRIRERTTHDRAEASTLRHAGAAERFATGEERDRLAQLRDRGAESRDTLARLHDSQEDGDATREEIRLRAERDRARAAADRVKAADDRARAAVERELAAAERAEVLQLRAEAERAMELAATDVLTGARTRHFGLEEMARELERAHRTDGTLLVAFVDVDGLKEVNDSDGHLAGDALLQLTGETLRSNLRTYDVVVRYGGDEFVCAMANLGKEVAKPRFAKIAAEIAARCPAHSITVGLAEADGGEDLLALIARADADLLGARRGRKG